MDVVFWVFDDFWCEWCCVVKVKKFDVLMVVEIWFDVFKYFFGDMFDLMMNYIFCNVVFDYVVGKSGKLMVVNLELLCEVYLLQVFMVLMNLLFIYDQLCVLYYFGEDSDFVLVKQCLCLVVFFQMIYFGVFIIYYGDEVGLGGGDDFGNCVFYFWVDEGGYFDEVLLVDFKCLIGLCYDLFVLCYGLLLVLLYVDDYVVVFVCQDGKMWVFIVINNSGMVRMVQVVVFFEMDYLCDVLSGEDFIVVY